MARMTRKAERKTFMGSMDVLDLWREDTRGEDFDKEKA